VVVGAFVVLNVWSVRLLPFRWQVGVIWCELLILFGAFFAAFDLSYAFIASRVPILIFVGAVTTIYVSLLSILFASVLALVAALGRLSSSGSAYAVSTFYISFFRGTPLLLQVYLIYLGLPQLGLVLDAVPSGIIALSLCYGAYMAEIFRAGIEGVPRGQSEAAAALGLHRGYIFRKIVFPQAMRLIIPPTGNQFIAMLKDSSLVSVMGVWELMFLARTQGRSEFKHFEMLIAAAVIYWIISFVFELVQARIERHFGKGIAR
jgi:polar amino acid transport system permease protein